MSVEPVGQGNPPSLNNNQDIEAPLIPAGRLLPFLVVTPLFFLWAIPNNLNDILIRQFMKSFDINRSSAAAASSFMPGLKARMATRRPANAP